MAKEFGLDLVGLDAIERKLGKLQRTVVEFGAIKAGAEDIKGTMQEYPPAPASSGPPKGYVRGHGMYGRKRTSQVLGKRWFVKTTDNVRGSIAFIVGNVSEYAEWVHGDNQASFHKLHGWRKLETVAKRELPKIRQKMAGVFREIIRSQA
jgi:hypothetical protein